MRFAMAALAAAYGLLGRSGQDSSHEPSAMLP